jgi:hypothetical protein
MLEIGWVAARWVGTRDINNTESGDRIITGCVKGHIPNKDELVTFIKNGVRVEMKCIQVETLIDYDTNSINYMIYLRNKMEDV